MAYELTISCAHCGGMFSKKVNSTLAITYFTHQPGCNKKTKVKIEGSKVKSTSKG